MAIEVILKKPVHNLGAEADVVKVKPGFARNYLFPQDIAAMATTASKRQIEELKKKRAEREAQELNEAQELASKLAKITVTFQMQTGGASKVFGSVTSNDIVKRLEEMGHKIEKKKLGLAHPIKNLGEHVLDINLGHDIHTKLKIVLDAPVDAEDVKEAKVKRGAKDKKNRAKASKKSKKEE